MKKVAFDFLRGCGCPLWYSKILFPSEQCCVGKEANSIFLSMRPFIKYIHYPWPFLHLFGPYLSRCSKLKPAEYCRHVREQHQHSSISFDQFWNNSKFSLVSECNAPISPLLFERVCINLTLKSAGGFRIQHIF